MSAVKVTPVFYLYIQTLQTVNVKPEGIPQHALGNRSVLNIQVWFVCMELLYLKYGRVKKMFVGCYKRSTSCHLQYLSKKRHMFGIGSISRKQT